MELTCHNRYDTLAFATRAQEKPASGLRGAWRQARPGGIHPADANSSRRTRTIDGSDHGTSLADVHGVTFLDRREPLRRAAFVETVVREIVQSPVLQFTTDEVRQLLQTSSDVAVRILHRLADAGVIRESRRDVWTKVVPQPQFTARMF